MPVRDMSSDLLNAITTGKPTLQVFLKITCADATVLGFTKFAESLLYNAVTYQPGLNVTTIDTSSGLSVDNLEVSGLFKDGTITELEAAAGKYDLAGFQLFIHDYENLTGKPLTIARGKVREIRSSDAVFTAELASLSHLLQVLIGNLVSPQCNVKKFGDARCKINLNGNHPTLSLPYKWTPVTVGAVVNRLRFTVASTSYPTEFFNGGELIWLTGANAGVKSEIKTFVKNVDNSCYFILQEPPRKATLTAGDTFSVSGGCNRTWQRCGFHDNRENFRGFVGLIGQRKLYTIAS